MRLDVAQREFDTASAAAAAANEEVGGRAPGAPGSGRGRVGESDVCRVVSRWTSIPVTKLVASERAKLLQVRFLLPDVSGWA